MSHNVIKLIIARLNIVYLVIGFIDQLGGALFIGLDRNVIAKLVQIDAPKSNIPFFFILLNPLQFNLIFHLIINLRF